jgi:chromosome segregation ATPase
MADPVTQEEALTRAVPWILAAAGGGGGLWALLRGLFGVLHEVQDLRREVAELQTENERARVDANGLGAKINALSERLVKTDAMLDAQTHRIDEHARRSEQSAGKGYAEHLRELCDQVEDILRRSKGSNA